MFAIGSPPARNTFSSSSSISVLKKLGGSVWKNRNARAVVRGLIYPYSIPNAAKELHHLCRSFHTSTDLAKKYMDFYVHTMDVSLSAIVLYT